MTVQELITRLQEYTKNEPGLLESIIYMTGDTDKTDYPYLWVEVDDVEFWIDMDKQPHLILTS